MAHELSHDELDQVLKTVDIPACPALVTQAMSEAQKDSPDLRVLARKIAADVGMSALAIKLANSPLFRAGAAVQNVQSALERLGTRNTVCVVVSVALRAAVSGGSPAFIERFWQKTASLAVSAGLIARRLHGVSPDVAYLFALFHDVGIPLMMRRFDHFEKLAADCERNGTSLIEAEEQFFPCSHPIVGGLLIRNWGLPGLIGKAVRFHHEADVYELPESTLPAEAVSLIAVTHIAEHLTCELEDLQDTEVGQVLFDKALAYFGLDTSDVEDLREQLAAAKTGSH